MPLLSSGSVAASPLSPDTELGCGGAVVRLVPLQSSTPPFPPSPPRRILVGPPIPSIPSSRIAPFPLLGNSIGNRPALLSPCGSATLASAPPFHSPSRVGIRSGRLAAAPSLLPLLRPTWPPPRILRSKLNQNLEHFDPKVLLGDRLSGLSYLPCTLYSLLPSLPLPVLVVCCEFLPGVGCVIPFLSICEAPRCAPVNRHSQAHHGAHKTPHSTRTLTHPHPHMPPFLPPRPSSLSCAADMPAVGIPISDPFFPIHRTINVH